MCGGQSFPAARYTIFKHTKSELEMLDSEVKIGMAVVPHAKTVPGYEGLDTSGRWGSAFSRWRESEQPQFDPHMIVVGKSTVDGVGVWVLDDPHTADAHSRYGDYFLSADFEPYLGIPDPMERREEECEAVPAECEAVPKAPTPTPEEPEPAAVEQAPEPQEVELPAGVSVVAKYRHDATGNEFSTLDELLSELPLLDFEAWYEREASELEGVHGYALAEWIARNATPVIQLLKKVHLV